MFGGDWNAEELMQLLEGLEQFGYGNWTDVACFVDTKNAYECRTAANQYFVNGEHLTYFEYLSIISYQQFCHKSQRNCNRTLYFRESRILL